MGVLRPHSKLDGRFIAKNTRRCTRCGRDRDKTEFFANQWVCFECSPDDRFVRKLKKLGKTEGLGVLKDKLNDYLRLARLTKEAIGDLTPKGEHN